MTIFQYHSLYLKEPYTGHESHLSLATSQFLVKERDAALQSYVAQLEDELQAAEVTKLKVAAQCQALQASFQQSCREAIPKPDPGEVVSSHLRLVQKHTLVHIVRWITTSCVSIIFS